MASTTEGKGKESSVSCQSLAGAARIWRYTAKKVGSTDVNVNITTTTAAKAEAAAAMPAFAKARLSPDYNNGIHLSKTDEAFGLDSVTITDLRTNEKNRENMISHDNGSINL